MIRALLVIILVGLVGFFGTDLRSDSLFRSQLLPLLIVVDLIALGIWLVLLFNKRGISQETNSRDVGGSGFDGFGDG